MCHTHFARSHHVCCSLIEKKACPELLTGAREGPLKKALKQVRRKLAAAPPPDASPAEAEAAEATPAAAQQQQPTPAAGTADAKAAAAATPAANGDARMASGSAEHVAPTLSANAADNGDSASARAAGGDSAPANAAADHGAAADGGTAAVGGAASVDAPPPQQLADSANGAATGASLALEGDGEPQTEPTAAADGVAMNADAGQAAQANTVVPGNSDGMPIAAAADTTTVAAQTAGEIRRSDQRANANLSSCCIAFFQAGFLSLLQPLR